MQKKRKRSPISVSEKGHDPNLRRALIKLIKSCFYKRI